MTSVVLSPKSRLPHARRGACAQTAQYASCVPPRHVRPLADYVDANGCTRELLALPGHRGSVLVLDRDAVTRRDRRLVAHLAADEPAENARLICSHYLNDTGGRWCRKVRPEDLLTAPVPSDDFPFQCEQESLEEQRDVVDPNGRAYRLRLLPNERSVDQLRWWRRCEHSCDRISRSTAFESRSTESQAGSSALESKWTESQVGSDSWEQVSLREVVASCESYEPMRTITENALARYRIPCGVSLTRLRREFDRLCTSPVVLNRGLREAVLEAISRSDTSMSEIALRCGVVKRDRHGNISGETSWLARRIGAMPEGGESKITPWIHSDVLATIARKGLGVSPREVELQ